MAAAFFVLKHLLRAALYFAHFLPKAGGKWGRNKRGGQAGKSDKTYRGHAATATSKRLQWRTPTCSCAVPACDMSWIGSGSGCWWAWARSCPKTNATGSCCCRCCRRCSRSRRRCYYHTGPPHHHHHHTTTTTQHRSPRPPNPTYPPSRARPRLERAPGGGGHARGKSRGQGEPLEAWGGVVEAAALGALPRRGGRAGAAPAPAGRGG